MSTSTKQQPLLMRAAAMLLLAMLTSATAWAWDGSGTKSDPYKIQNRADLVQLSTDINNSTSNLYDGTYFVQTADIDMSGVDFVPIGIDDIPYHRFRGNYDGKNYIIYNLTVNGSYYNAALFGYVNNGGIDNVWLVSPSITNTNTNTCYTGALIGYGNFPGIQNCVVINPTLSGGSRVGALAGWQSSGSIKYSYFTGNNNYDVVGYINGYTGNKEMGRAYTLTLADGITTSTAPAFSYGGTSYYAGTITLPAAPAGWVYAYSVNGSAIDGNTFDISADASVTVDRHISPLLGYNDDPLVDGSADHPYTITTTDGWNLFCDCLDDNDTWNHFSGKTVKLGADITVTRMAGGSDHAFVGTFDGQGHTLTVNYGLASAPLDAEFVAPFVEVRGNAEFFNLTIDGHIYAAYTGSGDSGVGGLIGHLFGGITIEGCTSTVEINSTKDRVGGFVGLCEHAVTFTNCKSSAVVTCTGSGSGFLGWSRNSEFIISFEGCLFNGKILKKDNVGSGNGGFVGWKGDNKIVNITNCLVDPAALDEGETMANGSSATFSREHDGYPATITNCYYTTAFGTAQGTQAYSISKGEYVTTLEISGTPTNSYPVSGLDFYSVGLKCGDVLYAAENNEVSLNLGCTPPSGYHFTGYTATGGTLNGTTLTMPNGNVTIDATIEQLTPVDYVDENGEAQQCTDYILLTGTETYLGTPDHETWYVVQGTLNYTKTLNLIGNTHIILADNAVMNITSNGTGISPVFSGPSFSIYGQTGQSGELKTSASQYALHVFGNITIAGGKVTASARYGIFAEADGSVTIKNATVTATGTGTEAVGIGTQGGDITIDNSNVTATAQGTAQCMAFQLQARRLQGGGNVIFRNGGKTRAEGGYCGIFCQGNVTIEGCQVEIYGGNYGIETNNITLGWTNPTDYIYANSYIDMQSDPITIATGKTFKTEDGHTYSGTIAMEYGTYPINGKRLYPDCVVMKQVEGYGDGNGGWVFIASPVAGSIAPLGVHNLIATTEEDYDLYRFNQSDPNGNEWQNWKATTSENHPDFTELVNGQGYLYATKEDRTLVFAGEYTAGTEPVEVPLAYDANAEFAGWNLVGNPFATPATMTDGNGQPIPFYVISGQNVVPYEGSATTIEPYTGVMVKAEGTGEKVYFTSASPDQAPQPNNGSLQIALSQAPEPVEGPARNDNVYSGVGVSTSSTTLIDNAIISFNEGSKLGKFYFGTQNANIYIPQGQEEYAIAFSESQGEMPLNFKAKENGTYTISVDVDNVEMGYLHLIDNMTGADVDLLAANGRDAMHCVSTYTFTAKTTDYESRFKLVFAAEGADGPSTGSGAFAYIHNGEIIINDADARGASLQVIDVTGRVVVSVGGHTRCVPTTGMTAGVYVLRLINGDDVRTQKIVID